MNKYVVGIRCKESGIISAMSVVDDVARWKDDVRASLHNNPTCAYALYPDNYEFVYQTLTIVWDVGGSLPKIEGSDADKMA